MHLVSYGKKELYSNLGQTSHTAFCVKLYGLSGVGEWGGGRDNSNNNKTHTHISNRSLSKCTCICVDRTFLHSIFGCGLSSPLEISPVD